MKILVIDNIGSFSLVPYLREKLEKNGHEIWTMFNIENDKLWGTLKQLNPDIVFVDFCNENAVTLIKRIHELPKKPKVVIRLHRYEIYSWYVKHIDWKKVDTLITVSPKFKEIVSNQKDIKNSGVNVCTVPNGIDLQKFQLQELFDDAIIAYAGYLNMKKAPALFRTIMASMPDKKFHIGGIHQDAQVHLYFDDLKLNNVTYHGWTKTEEFLKGKRFILSTSVTESFGMSIAEGMAMGLTPLVHAWPGADLLWPKECIWKTFDELKAIQPKEPTWCRKWIEDRYSMDKCIEKTIDILLH